MKRLLALDVDGVINCFSKRLRNSDKSEVLTIAGFTITLRLPVLTELTDFLKNNPDITVAWLTTWVDFPEMLDTLEEATGLKGLVKYRVPSRIIAPYHKVSTNPSDPKWWKFEAWDNLLREHDPDKAVWIDDDLNRCWEYRNDDLDDAHLLFRTDPAAGLLLPELQNIEEWLNSPLDDLIDKP